MNCIWVAGVSGVGKRTFIERAVGDSALLARLAIAEPVTAFAESLEWPFRDFTVEAIEAAARSGCLFIKWQFATNAHLLELARRAPSATQRVLRLVRPEAEISASLAKRLASNPSYTTIRDTSIDRIREESRRVDVALGALQESVAVDILDVSRPDLPTIPSMLR